MSGETGISSALVQLVMALIDFIISFIFMSAGKENIDPRFHLGTEMPDQALDRPGGRIAERADRVAFDLLGHIVEHVDLALRALPVTMRSITRIIQPVPSRQGVHWPQLSCL
jgi:hypothetical protein